jgi:hypothetical protein
MRLFLFTILFMTGIFPAIAGDYVMPAPPPPGKITIAQANPMATALRNLDGHMIVIKQNGADTAIMAPWEFGSGSLRLRIANDLTLLDAVLKVAEEARGTIVKELLKKASDRTGETLTELKAGTPENDEFQKQFAELLAQPAPGTQDLARIKASELKLDRNEIPVTVLSALAPILDQDIK